MDQDCKIFMYQYLVSGYYSGGLNIYFFNNSSKTTCQVQLILVGKGAGGWLPAYDVFVFILLSIYSLYTKSF